mgnify:FL=1
MKRSRIGVYRRSIWKASSWCCPSLMIISHYRWSGKCSRAVDCHGRMSTNNHRAQPQKPPYGTIRTWWTCHPLSTRSSSQVHTPVNNRRKSTQSTTSSRTPARTPNLASATVQFQTRKKSTGSFNYNLSRKTSFESLNIIFRFYNNVFYTKFTFLCNFNLIQIIEKNKFLFVLCVKLFNYSSLKIVFTCRK